MCVRIKPELITDMRGQKESKDKETEYKVEPYEIAICVGQKQNISNFSVQPNKKMLVWS